MKKVLVISSALLGVIFLAGCTQQPVSQKQPTTPPPVVQQPATNQPVITQTAPTTPPAMTNEAIAKGLLEKKNVVYTNDEFGFKLQLPDNWEGYATKVNRSSTYELFDGKSISCPDCTTIDFYLPYNANWKLHQDVPATGNVQVMTLQVQNIDTWSTKCKTHCKNGEPSCTDCDDYLLNSERFNFNVWYTVQFPDDINPETKEFHNSANEFFKNKFTITKK